MKHAARHTPWTVVRTRYGTFQTAEQKRYCNGSAGLLHSPSLELLLAACKITARLSCLTRSAPIVSSRRFVCASCSRFVFTRRRCSFSSSTCQRHTIRLVRGRVAVSADPFALPHLRPSRRGWGS